ncbi:hypothetical protein GC177_08865 [bacterium]|nr:hypothetical protein [bacterium]
MIELAVLMTVLAAAMVATLSWIAPSSTENAQRITTTRERMDVVTQALHAFRSKYGRLPCPANPAYGEDHQNNGMEDCWEHTGTPNFRYSMRGSIPTRTLGISPEYAQDGWNRLFTYQVSRMICDFDPTAPIANQVGQPINCSAGDYEQGTGAAGAGSGWLSISTTDPTSNCADGVSCDIPVTDSAAYILISHGPNGFGAWLPSGVQKGVGSISAREDRNRHNGDGDTDFWDDHFSNSFDDLVYYETRDQVNQSTTDFDRIPFSQEECQDMASLTLSQFTNAEAGSVNGSGTLTALFTTGMQPDAALLDLLWETQEVCAKLYSGVYNGSGFTTLSHGMTLINANSFTVVGDKTDIYTAGRSIRFTDPVGGGAITRNVASSSYAAGTNLTTVNLAAGTALTSAYSQVAVNGDPMACPGSSSATGRKFNRTLWDTDDFDGGINTDVDTGGGVIVSQYDPGTPPDSGFYPNSGNSAGSYTAYKNPNPIGYKDPALADDRVSSPNKPAATSHLGKMKANDLFNGRIGFCACPSTLPVWNNNTGVCQAACGGATPNWNTITFTCDPACGGGLVWDPVTNSCITPPP